jgi:chromate transporter
LYFYAVSGGYDYLRALSGKKKSSILLKAAMRGIRAAVIGMILAAAYVVASTAEMNRISLLIFTASLVAMLKLKWEVAMIIPGAGSLGHLLYR